MSARACLSPLAALLAGCATAPAPRRSPTRRAGQRPGPPRARTSTSGTSPARRSGSTATPTTSAPAASPSLLIVGPEGHVLIDSGTDERRQARRSPTSARSASSPSDVEYIADQPRASRPCRRDGASCKRRPARRSLASAAAATVLRQRRARPADPQAASRAIPRSRRSTGKIVMLDGERAGCSADSTFRPSPRPATRPARLSWTVAGLRRRDGCKSIVYADSLNPISRRRLPLLRSSRPTSPPSARWLAKVAARAVRHRASRRTPAPARCARGCAATSR